MKRKTITYFHKLATLALAAAMVLSALCVLPPTEVSAASRTFRSSGKSSVVIQDKQDFASTQKLVWVKYKAANDGYLKITAQNASDKYADTYVTGSWQLYNKNKKSAVSPIKLYNTNANDSFYYTDVYGVKKGTVYYLAVKADGGVKITASFTKVTDKSGAKKAKSLKLAKGKTTTGLIRVGDNKVSDWYKFTLTSPKKLNICFTPYMNDSMTISITGPAGSLKPFSSSVRMSSLDGDKLNYGRKCSLTTREPVKAGTYYIQIKPTNKTTSGYYKLVWK